MNSTAKRSDNAAELLPLVDHEGRVTGSATRAECHGPGRPLHPVVHLHLFDRQGRLYLQKRPEWKDVQPGRWDTAVGGHIDFGEDVPEALRREAREELGITDFEPVFITRYIFECEREREMVNVFYAVTDREPQPSDELDGGRFFTHDEIARAMGSGLFTPNFESEYGRLSGMEGTPFQQS